MINKRKRKRRMGKALSRRRKEVDREQLAEAWRNIFVRAGILSNKKDHL